MGNAYGQRVESICQTSATALRASVDHFHAADYDDDHWAVPGFNAGNPTMKFPTVHRILTWFIAGVWFGFGLFCKVLNLVPRQEQIVARILGEQYAVLLTKSIGAAEIVMAIWILSGIQSRANAVTQIAIVGAMNVLEFFLAPDLLLWGRFNAVFAMMFMCMVYYNEFVLRR